MKELPKRKNIRLKNYDYAQPGYYFITICTNKKRCLLSNIVGDGFYDVPQVKLTTIGKEIIKSIEYIDKNYCNVKIDKYIVMPNHMHIIVILKPLETGRRRDLPLHRVIGQFKSYTNKIYNDLNQRKNLMLWQRNYYEHIIRDEIEYRKIWQYIDTNPIKWKDDQYYL